MDANAGLPAEVVALRRTARDFADREIRPRVEEMEAQQHIPDDLVAALGEVGFFGVAASEEWGGAGLGDLGLAVTLEELAKAHASTALLLSVSAGLGIPLVRDFGTEEQRRRLLPGIASGQSIAAFCLTEPGGGSDVPAMRTRARADGDEWVIDGEKAFVTNGDRAGVYLVFAKTDPDAGREGISLFAVERGTAGLSVARLEDKMGLRASATAHVALDGVRVPRTALIGKPEGGFRMALSVLNGSRLGIAAMCLGVAKEGLDAGWSYAHSRELFGTTVAGFQVNQHALADMQVEIAAVEALIYRTAAQLDAGADVAAEASACKILATETAQRVVDRALQLHGGVGYLRGTTIERLYRDIRVARIYEGANEVQRGNVYRVMRHQRGAGG